MNKKTILVIAAILVVLGAGYAVARPGFFWNGMMGSYGASYGMMGNGKMMGIATGITAGSQCMGAGNPGYGANATPISIDEAKTAVEKYLAGTGNTDLALAEVLQFQNNFYAAIKEKSTSKYAFELLVNKYTGYVIPEMGPNMMWNKKYGHINIGETEVKVSKEQAMKIAQEYLDSALSGTKLNQPDDFYGYYTMEVTKDSKIFGMLSVNSNTGAVWYHNWHGAFEKVLELD
jgi:uncharacterized membrane protein YkoI